MKYGWVKINLVDLWTKPKFNSERASQLLFAEPVKIGGSRGGFYSVMQADNYRGWVDQRFIELSSKPAYMELLANRNFFVSASTAQVYDSRGKGGTSPFFLYYGTKLRIGRTKDGFATVNLAGNQSFLIKKSNLVPINKESASVCTGRKLVAQAMRFLGVPYLWGGVTSAGFDCSGFVQTVLARFGIVIPRDTKDQIQVGEKVKRDCIRTGDLLFFKRHVGFAVGPDRVIHCSAGGGGVRVNSLIGTGTDYREDLDRDFNQARRIICSS